MRIGFADWQAGVILLAMLPLVPLFMVLVGMMTRRRMDRQYAVLAGMAGHFLDLVQGLTTLKVYGQAQRQETTVRQGTEKYRHQTMATLRMAFLSGSGPRSGRGPVRRGGRCRRRASPGPRSSSACGRPGGVAARAGTVRTSAGDGRAAPRERGGHRRSLGGARHYRRGPRLPGPAAARRRRYDGSARVRRRYACPTATARARPGRTGPGRRTGRVRRPAGRERCRQDARARRAARASWPRMQATSSPASASDLPGRPHRARGPRPGRLARPWPGCRNGPVRRQPTVADEVALATRAGAPRWPTPSPTATPAAATAARRGRRAGLGRPAPPRRARPCPVARPAGCARARRPIVLLDEPSEDLDATTELVVASVIAELAGWATLIVPRTAAGWRTSPTAGSVLWRAAARRHSADRSTPVAGAPIGAGPCRNPRARAGSARTSHRLR